MTRFCKIAFVFGAMAATSAATSLQAEENLPGVSESYSIVKPLPEPIEATPKDGEAIKVGDWDVRISGSVTVDVGTRNLPPSHR